MKILLQPFIFMSFLVNVQSTSSTKILRWFIDNDLRNFSYGGIYLVDGLSEFQGIFCKCINYNEYKKQRTDSIKKNHNHVESVRLIKESVASKYHEEVAVLNSPQPTAYSTANAHSHNDYEQAEPFQMAYRKGFGSIEADVFLANNDLFVAHELKDTQAKKTLRSLYLEPIRKNIIKNKGNIYPDKRKKLILLIDFKTEAITTINELIRQLNDYPEIRKCKTLQIIISGNRPDKKELHRYPKYIWFDGRFTERYAKKNLKRIGLMSASFKNFSKWNGKDSLDLYTRQRLVAEIGNVRTVKKPIRLWATPDTQKTWIFLMDLGVDFINTDKIDELASFLTSRRAGH